MHNPALQSLPRSENEFDGWQFYPANNSRYHAAKADGANYSRLLHKHSSDLCINETNELMVIIDEVSEIGHYRHELTTEIALEAYLKKYANETQKPDIFISIPRGNSSSPLKITEEGIRKLLTVLDVPFDILNMLFNFGSDPVPTSDGLADAIFRCPQERILEINYLFHYVEEIEDPDYRWRTRCTGIYHRFTKSGANVCLLLHPRVETNALVRLTKNFTQSKDANHMLENPLNVHFLLLSSYFENWRWHIYDIGEKFLKVSDEATALRIHDPLHYALTFKNLQDLRGLEKNVLPLIAKFKATATIINVLKAANEKVHELGAWPAAHLDVTSELDGYLSKLNEYNIGLDVVLKRMDSIFTLLAHGLDTKNQNLAEEANRHMLHLTEHTVDDSSTVKVITLVTLIYLPSSFVAALFGMNLFAFSDPDPRLNGILVSRKFWIFVLVALPLTAITLSYWFWLLHRQKSQRARRPSPYIIDTEKGQSNSL